MRNKQDLTKENQEKSIKNASDFLVRNNQSLVIINQSLVRKNREKILGRYGDINQDKTKKNSD